MADQAPLGRRASLPVQTDRAWGKFDPKTATYLPLSVHLCDVAACFSVISSLKLYHARLATAAGQAISPCLHQRLCALAFLHDIGKANSGFQSKGWPAPIAQEGHTKAGHTREGLDLLCCEELSNALGSMFKRWGDEAAGALFLAALAHHGRPVIVHEYQPDKRRWKAHGAYDPKSEVEHLLTLLGRTFPLACTQGDPLPPTAPFQHLFAGLVALADQVGSMTDFFPLHRRESQDSFADSLMRAKRAVAALNLDVAPLRAVCRCHTVPPWQLFNWPPGSTLTPMQKACLELDGAARLAILESATGSGKTEAAFLRFSRLFADGLVDGLYFAVPTRAAASALHRRLDQAARKGLGAPAVLAVPGYLKVGEATGTALPDWQVRWDDDPSEDQRAARWSAETPRRFLASVIAVGTVDQAILAGLKVKWSHFRGAVLSRSLLVIDEVHASDVYMTRVLSRLVQSHVENGGYAMLMSATLGGAARHRWLKGKFRCKSKDDGESLKKVPYPLLSVKRKKGVERYQLSHDGTKKHVRIETIDAMEDPDRVAALAAEAVRKGAKVLVIRNTVESALSVQRAFEDSHPELPSLNVNGRKTLHHSRFAREDRCLLDAALDKTFGKDSPPSAILAVGTQTLEQSLDISCDMLITDLCPIDVLLQRLGRLHRHKIRRALECAQAFCHVLVPKTLKPDGALLRFGLGMSKTGGVYQDITGLEATRQLINRRPLWTLPDDNRLLVEDATDPSHLDCLARTLGKSWVTARNTLEGRGAAQKNAATFSILDHTCPFDGYAEVFPSDEHIRTRLGENSWVLDIPEIPGPFGTPISQIALPAHMLGSACPDDAVSTTMTEAGLCLHLGPSCYLYSRHGLEKSTIL